MTSQVCNETVTVLAGKLCIGDVIFGADGQTWSNRWLVYEGPKESSIGSSYVKYIVGRVGPIYEDEKIDWDIMRDTQIMVEDRTFQYDPKQAGDLEEDI